MKLKIIQVDAFTDRPFSGNPAAVCALSTIEAQQLTDGHRQAIAAEMNLAETAFIEGEGENFELRWFTPKVEVDLCGHATLAAAHVLWSEGTVDWRRPISFQTRSGILVCRHSSNEAWGNPTIELDFPRLDYSKVEPPAGLLEALGGEALGESPISVVKSSMDYLVEIADEQRLRNLTPDFGLLARVNTRGIVVTARASNDSYDFISRFFAPAVGIDEDPVTGSTHCLLGPYWEHRLGKTEFQAFQASERGGTIGVRLAGQRVRLIGQAVSVLHGELTF